MDLSKNTFICDEIHSLHENNNVYFVEEGEIDLYFCKIDKNNKKGRRYHFVSLKKGDIFYDFPYFDNLEFFALGTSSSKLSFISWGSFFSKFQKTEQDYNELSILFENWIKKIYKFLSKSFINTNSLTPFENQSQIEEPTIFRPISLDIFWLEIKKGEVFLFDNEQLSVNTKTQYFPFNNKTWFSVKKELNCNLLTTKELIKQNSSHETFKNFYYFLQKAVILFLNQNDTKEQERLKNKVEHDEKKLETALLNLSMTIDKDYKQNISIQEDLDPHTLACKIVGEHLGAKIIQYKELKKNPNIKNPIQKIARASGIKAREVVLMGDWYKKDHGGLVGYYKEGSKKEVVALIPSHNKSYRMINPVKQTEVIVDEQIADSLENIAFMMYKSLPHRALNLKDIFNFILQPLKKDLSLIIFSGLLVGILGMVTPIFTGKLFNTIIPESNHFQLLQIAIALVAIAISTALFNFTKGMATARAKGHISLHLQSAIWDRLLSLPAPFFRNYSVGDLAMRANGINAIEEALTGTLLSTLLSGFFSFFSLFLLFYYNVKLASVALALVIIAMSFSLISAYIQAKYQRKIIEKGGKLTGFILQLLNGIQKIRVANAEKRAFYEWSKKYSEQRNISFKAGNSQNYLELFNSSFPVLTNIVIFASVVFLLNQENTKFSTGDFIAFTAAFGQFLSASLSISGVVIKIIDIIPIYKRIEPIFKTLPEVNKAQADPGKLTGLIETNGIRFQYPNTQKEVLKNITFSIEPGSFVAFVGPSGSGKSTILRLLLGFEKPKSGSIYFDKQSLAELDILEVRSQIGSVLQNGQIIQGDIFSNIVGATGMSLDDAWEAAKMAGFDEDIRQMPMEMHTIVNAGGGTLSGGQRQRLLISRALITKPKIILFDEATSALDNYTQSIVTKSLEQLQATRIVIAHRLSTIENADYIYVIDDGEIKEHGHYSSLIKQDGLFKKLASRQIT